MHRGQTVVYLGASLEQVRWGGNDDPRDLLVLGGLYTIARIDVHSWHTKIQLEEAPGKWFNSASFQGAERERYA